MKILGRSGLQMKEERKEKKVDLQQTAQKKDFKFDQSFSTVKISHGYN